MGELSRKNEAPAPTPIPCPLCQRPKDPLLETCLQCGRELQIQLSISSEIPDSHIVCHAQQFLMAAESLLSIGAPSALKCNAAFAIELFLKSLNSSWAKQDLSGKRDTTKSGDATVKIVDVNAVASKSNMRGHTLDKLFGDLPSNMQGQLNVSFTDHSLAADGATLDSLLKRYRTAFNDERYGFEKLLHDNSHPIREIVDLARFFDEFVRKLPATRY